MAEDHPPEDPPEDPPDRHGPSAGDRGRALWTRVRDSGALKWLAIAGGVFLLFLGAAWFTCGFQGCPDPSSLTAWEPGGAPVILDRNGEEFATLVPVQRELVDIDSLPDHVAQAFIAVEDRRFRSHGGVDVRRVLGALLANIKAGGVSEGGSTITMQLARNAFPEQLPASQRNLRRKLGESRVAMKIEDEFGKDQILGLYLNQIYFGNGASGVAAASRHYFGVPPAELRPEQAALLAAMVKAPAHYDPREDQEEALERRNLVLDLMHEEGYLSAEELAGAKETGLDVTSGTGVADAGEALPAPWFLEAVQDALEEELGSDLYRTQLRVHTSIDPALQEAAEEALQDQLSAVESGRFGTYRGAAYDPTAAPEAEGSSYLQGAVVVVDARDGGILALVGGRNHRHSAFDHVFDADRQVGSAFKPFVYGAALAEGIPPSHRLDDSPLSIEMRGSPTYEPSNYDGRFEGPMSAREALRQSRNVPTVRLAQEVGTGEVADFARTVGIEGEIAEGPSMALGTVTLSPMELARAYTTFAGLGRSVEPRVISRVETAGGEVLWESEVRQEDRVEPAVAYVLNDMLQDVIDGGTGAGARAAGFRGPAAGKTGTTQEAADVWFVGYTPELVGVVWMGFDQPAPILADATGGGLAAPVWGRMMARGGRSGAEWEMPDGVARLPYDPRTGRALPRDCPGAAGAPTDLFFGGRASGACPTSAADTFGSDTLALDTLGMDSLGLDSLGIDSMGRDTMLRDTARGVRPLPDTLRDTLRIDTTRRDTTGTDTTRTDTIKSDSTRADTTRADTTRAPRNRADTTRAPGNRGDTAQGDTTLLSLRSVAGPAPPPPGARPGR